jgi:hypothetical protein
MLMLCRFDIGPAVPGGSTVEHNKEYQSGRYRVVEQIEHVKVGYRVSVTAYDDQVAKELNGVPESITRFDARLVAHTLDGARRDLTTAVNLMKKSIAQDMP